MGKSSAEITKLINCLESLHGGDHAVDLLAACGEEAIAPLRNYLVEGKPNHIYQPRQRAVIALAKLGAKEVLMEYLSMQKDISDPVTRFGEEAVENTTARLLARWQTGDVFELLLRIAYTRTLPGVIEALGSFRRPESIPLFIAALMDDVSRNAAKNALKAIDETARSALIEVVRTSPDGSENGESPSSLLQDMTVNVKEWPTLKELLHDADLEISILAAFLALDIAGLEDKNVALKTLIGKIPAANWYNKMEIENGLVKHYGVAERDIKDHIEQRRRQTEKKQAADSVLQILLNIRRRTEGELIDE
jgi:hypothetical protein